MIIELPSHDYYTGPGLRLRTCKMWEKINDLMHTLINLLTSMTSFQKFNNIMEIPKLYYIIMLWYCG